MGYAVTTYNNIYSYNAMRSIELMRVEIFIWWTG